MNERITSPKDESFLDLVGDLRSDLTNLVKKEISLAKTEISEKVSKAGRNAVYMVAGGVFALMALFLLFIGLGALLAMLFRQADLSPGSSYFLGYLTLGVALAVSGWAMIQKGLHAFSHFSLSPEKALEPIKGQESQAVSVRKIEVEEPQRSSDEIKTEVDITRARMDQEMTELRHRLTPAYMVRSTFAGMKHHPLRALLIGAGTGIGGYLLWRRNHSPIKTPTGFRWSPGYWIGRLKGARA